MHLIDCECSERFLGLKHISEVLALTGEPLDLSLWTIDYSNLAIWSHQAHHWVVKYLK